jgi:hypothetical protein
MILAFASGRFTLVAGFFEVQVQLAFGFPTALPYGPHLLGCRVSPVL